MASSRLVRPLGPGELGFWLTHLAEPADPASHLHRLLEIVPSLPDDLVRDRATAMAKRLAVLRRGVVARDGDADPWMFEADELDEGWIHLDEGEGDAESIDECVQRPLSLAEPPLLRLHVFQAGTRTKLLLVGHHVLLDGVSFDNLTSDLVRGVVGGATTPAHISETDAEVPWQPVDDATWRELINTPEQAVGLRPASPGTADVCRLDALSPVAMRQLDHLRDRTGMSSATVLLTAWLATIHRVLDLTDVVAATQVDVRPRGARAATGMYVNTVPLLSRLPGQSTWTAFGDAVRERALDALRHRFEPFDEVLDVVKPERRADRSTMFTDFEFSSMRRWRPPNDVADGSSSVSEELRPDPGTRFGLSLNVIDGGGQIHVRWSASASLYSLDDLTLLQRTLERMVLDWAAEVDGSGMGPSAIEIVAEDERDAILRLGTGRIAPVPLEPIVSRFYAIAEQTPDADAVVHGERRATYGDLASRVASIASALASRRVGRADRVLVCCGRGLEHIASMLAIFHIGAVYVPCDASNPPARVARMVRDVGPACAIVDATISAEVRAEVRSGPKIAVEEIPNTDEPLAVGPAPIGPGDPAYIVFTSGSTGRPKAIEIGAQAFLNHLLMVEEDLQLDAGARVAQTAPLAFDIHVWQCLSALLVGGQVVVFDELELQDPATFMRRVTADQVTVLELVPSYLRAIIGLLGDELDEEHVVRFLLPTGEALQPDLALRLLETFRGVRILNAYGPAEAADDVTLEPVTRAMIGAAVPIGWPARNAHLRVCDHWMRLRPLGLPGELVVGGLVLANGYVSGAARDSFGIDPYFADGRIYRTGDVAFLSDTTGFTFLGRRDHQVKIGGRRVELGEVEAAIQTVPGVLDAAAVKVNRGLRTDLVAFVVHHEPAAVSAIRTELRRQLPPGMIPSSIRAIERLPTTASGKIDRRSLAELAINEAVGSALAPTDTVAGLVVRAWAHVLGPAIDLDVDDGFFASGGDSLAAAELIARLRASGVSVGVRDLYEHQTLGDFIGTVRSAIRTPPGRDQLVSESGASPRQVEMLQGLASGAPVPVQALVVTDGPTTDSLRAALATVAQRRPELRLAVGLGAETEWRMVARPPSDRDTIPRIATRVAATDEIDLVSAAALTLNVRSGRHIGLSSDTQGRTCVVVSHLVCDIVGLRSLLADLQFELGTGTRRLQVDEGLSPFLLWLQEIARRTRTQDPRALAAYRSEVVSCTRAVVAASSASPSNFEDPWAAAPDGSRSISHMHTLPAPVDRSDVELLVVASVGLALRETLATSRLRVDLDVDGRRAFEAVDILGEGIGCFTLLQPVPIYVEPGADDAIDMVAAVARSLSIARTAWAWDTSAPATRTAADEDLRRVPLVNFVGETLSVDVEPTLGEWRVPSCVTVWNAASDQHGIVVDVALESDPAGAPIALACTFTEPAERADPALHALPSYLEAALQAVAPVLASTQGAWAPEGLDVAGIPLAELDNFVEEALGARERSASWTGPT